MPEAIGGSDLKSVVAEVAYERFSDEGWVRASHCVPREMELTIYVNQSSVTILCTPIKLNYSSLEYL